MENNVNTKEGVIVAENKQEAEEPWNMQDAEEKMQKSTSKKSTT